MYSCMIDTGLSSDDTLHVHILNPLFVRYCVGLLNIIYVLLHRVLNKSRWRSGMITGLPIGRPGFNSRSRQDAFSR